MAQATLVENQLEYGQKLVDELCRRNFGVTAACWIKISEKGKWYFYIASKMVDATGPAAAYREVNQTIRRTSDIKFDLFEVKLIGATNPITVDVLEFQRSYPLQVPGWFHGARLGDVSIDEAYIYAPVRP